MTSAIEIRQSTKGDFDDIRALYPQAFPDEDLLPVVDALLGDPANALSLVATSDAKLVGNVIFTRCDVNGRDDRSAMLAPLAVAPAMQRQGVGSKLVRAGLEVLAAEGVNHVFVLGDPAYYGRLGFLPGSAVSPPYPLPQEWQHAWQSLSLTGDEPPEGGQILLPVYWLEPALWMP